MIKLPLNDKEKIKFFRKIIKIAHRKSGYKDYTEFCEAMSAQYRPNRVTQVKCAVFDILHEKLSVREIAFCFNTTKKTVYVMLRKSAKKTKHGKNIILTQIKLKLNGKCNIRPIDKPIVSNSTETSRQ